MSDVVDVQALRKKLAISQMEFAARFGFSLATVQTWEHGHINPDGPAKVLLNLIAKRPDIVERVLAVGQRSSCRYFTFDKTGQHDVDVRMV